MYMRKERELAEDVWYVINTAVNNGEPLFLSEFGVWLLEWVLSEARLIFAFELRGVRVAGATVSFFIKPANGLQLPEIMKWIKQVFAVRFKWDDGRTGHIWGDRYGSEILPGEPPEWAEVYAFMAIECPVRRGDWKREAARLGLGLGLGRKAGNAGAASRAPDAEGRPRPWHEAEKARVQAGLPRSNGSRPA
jgi:hypothetical protein